VNNKSFVPLGLSPNIILGVLLSPPFTVLLANPTKSVSEALIINES
jgi:hypothetical protein